LGIFRSYLWVKILYVLKVFCWSLLLIIPGVIFGVYYSSSSLALIVDNKRGQEALKLSQMVIKPNFTKYLTCLLLMFILLLIACVLFIFVFDTYIVLFTLRGKLFLAEVIGFLEVTWIAMAGVFFYVFYYYLYKDLKDNRKYF